jgi:hypothetical protein
MYWYNPTTCASERVEAPFTDEQAIRMLAGTQDSAEFIKEYCELRRSGRRSSKLWCWWDMSFA